MANSILKLLSATALLGSGVLANAATITVVQQLDLNQFNFSSSSIGLGGLLTAGSFNVASGDTIDFTFDFVGNQTLRMTNPSYFFAVVNRPTPLGFHTSTGSAQFLNASGPSTGSVSVVETSCCHHLGPTFQSAELATGPGVVEFSGLRTIVTVTGFGSTTISGFNFLAQASDLEIGSYSDPVPEPASLVLLGGGLLGFAGLRRRRTA